MKEPKHYLIVLLLLNATLVTAQGYQALNGSPYTGSTAVFNNPAASVGSAYKWDLSLFSLQLKMSTNSVYLKNFSLSNQDSAQIKFNQGLSSHFIHATVDVSLLNFLYKIDNKRAVNFNLRARTYNHIKTLPVNIVDTVTSIHSFLVTNRNTPEIEGFVTHAGWLEADLNYSQVLMENSSSKLSGGITLQIMKGISGAFLKINKLTYLESKNATDTTYNFTNGSGGFGYSDNYDAGSGSGGLSDFLKRSNTSLGMSLGIEYLIYNTGIYTEQVNNNLNYDWKIGASLMDIGANSFKPSANSTQFINPVTAISDNTVDSKFSHTTNLQGLVDSLKTLFNSSATITNNFTISNPTRLVINVDKNLGNHFYVNGDMSLNFYSTSSYTQLHTRELNLITITPRWETIGLGAYLPVQYNTQGQFWVGAAVKLGPLVMGIHNLGIFKKDPYLNGGGYILLSIHPFSKTKVLSKMDCPQ
jgi:hypothetical protein